MNPLDREQHDREDAADAICEEVRRYVLKGATVEVAFERIPVDVWERAPGLIISDHQKREQFGPHIFVYWKEGA